MKSIQPIRDFVKVQDPNVFRDLVIEQADGEFGEFNPTEIDLLVVEDGTGSWRKYPKSNPPSDNPHEALNVVNTVLNTPDQRGNDLVAPRVIVNLTHDLPPVERDIEGRLKFCKELYFWNTLEKHADKVCVICAVKTLRHQGAAISRRLSWEQTIEDIAAEILAFR